MTGYLTAAGYGEAEVEDKRSRFIAHVRPVSSEPEARAFLESVRAKHPDARHHVFAYLLRQGNILRWSEHFDLIPEEGSCFAWHSLRVTVTGLQGRRIRKLRVELLPEPATEGGDEG